MGATEEQLKLLVSRLIEANSIRELLQQDKLKDALVEVPHIIDLLSASVAINTTRFEQTFVEPTPLSKLPHINQTIAQANSEELFEISKTAIYMMEREIFNISKRVLESQ